MKKKKKFFFLLSPLVAGGELRSTVWKKKYARVIPMRHVRGTVADADVIFV